MHRYAKKIQGREDVQLAALKNKTGQGCCDGVLRVSDLPDYDDITSTVKPSLLSIIVGRISVSLYQAVSLATVSSVALIADLITSRGNETPCLRRQSLHNAQTNSNALGCLLEDRQLSICLEQTARHFTQFQHHLQMGSQDWAMSPLSLCTCWTTILQCLRKMCVQKSLPRFVAFILFTFWFIYFELLINSLYILKINTTTNSPKASSFYIVYHVEISCFRHHVELSVLLVLYYLYLYWYLLC